MLRVYTPDLTFVGIVDDYEEILTVRRFHEPGEIVARIHANKPNSKLLLKNRIVQVGDGFYILKERAIDDMGTRGNCWVVRGWTLSGITRQRLIVPDSIESTDYYLPDLINVSPGHWAENYLGWIDGLDSEPVETVMKYFVERNLITPEGIARRINNLVNAPDQGRGTSIIRSSRLESLSDVLTELSDHYNMGWAITGDLTNKELVFEVYESTDRSIEQDLYTPVILHYDTDAFRSLIYINSDVGYVNIAYTGGEIASATVTQDGSDYNLNAQLVVPVGESSGLDRYEGVVNASDIKSFTGISEENPLQLLQVYGSARLAQYHQEHADGVARPNYQYVFGVDYQLGDVITTVHPHWDLTLSAQVVEIREVYDAIGYSYDVVLASRLKGFPQMLRKYLADLGIK